MILPRISQQFNQCFCIFRRFGSFGKCQPRVSVRSSILEPGTVPGKPINRYFLNKIYDYQTILVDSLGAAASLMFTFQTSRLT